MQLGYGPPHSLLHAVPDVSIYLSNNEAPVLGRCVLEGNCMHAMLISAEIECSLFCQILAVLLQVQAYLVRALLTTLQCTCMFRTSQTT
jgi:hypothetical protein